MVAFGIGSSTSGALVDASAAFKSIGAKTNIASVAHKAERWSKIERFNCIGRYCCVRAQAQARISKNAQNFALSETRLLAYFQRMLLFAIAMIVLGLLAAGGFFIANRTPQQSEQPIELGPTNEDVVTYLAAEVPAILQEALAAVPLAAVEEAIVGCYGMIGPSADKTSFRPFQSTTSDELLLRTISVVTAMQNEQHIAKFTVSTYGKSKTNPHVDLLAHSTEPKRTRSIRFWRTPDGYVASFPA